MIKDFAKKFSVYTLVSLIGGTISFLLLPVLTHYLSPEDYGILSIVNALILFFSILISFGTISLLMVKLAQEPMDEFKGWLKVFLTSSTVFALFFIGVTLILGYFTGDFFGVPLKFAWFIPIIALMVALYEFFLNYSIQQQRMATYAKIALTKFGLEIGLTLLMVVGLGLGWLGRISGLWIALLIVLVMPFYVFYKREWLNGKFEIKRGKKLLSGGIHMILFSVAIIVMNLADRFFLEHMVGLELTGVYSIGYVVGSIELILGNSLIAIFRPEIFKLTKNKVLNWRHLRRTSALHLTALSIGLLGLYLGKELIFEWLIDPKFASGIAYVMWVATGFLFWGIFNLFISYFIALERLKFISWLSLFGIILNAALNYFLILQMGALGAAVATTITYLIMAVILLLAFKPVVLSKINQTLVE